MQQSRNKASAGSVQGLVGVCCRVESRACMHGQQPGRAQWRPSSLSTFRGEHVFANARRRTRRAGEEGWPSMGVTEPGARRGPLQESGGRGRKKGREQERMNAALAWPSSRSSCGFRRQAPTNGGRGARWVGLAQRPQDCVHMGRALRQGGWQAGYRGRAAKYQVVVAVARCALYWIGKWSGGAVLPGRSSRPPPTL